MDSWLGFFHANKLRLRKVISAMRKKAMAGNKTKSRKDYLTTTELARLCGVSRFTIVNWVNQGKIRAIRTVGKHYRIPLSEAISLFEAFRNEKNGVASGSLGHCWEYVQKASCDKKCGDCLIYGRKINHCFVVVQQFGKEVIHCKGDCLNCGYFKEFFSIYSKTEQLEEPCDKKSEEATREKRDFLYYFVYGVGRGVHEVKETVVNLRDRFAGRRPRINRQVEKCDF